MDIWDWTLFLQIRYVTMFGQVTIFELGFLWMRWKHGGWISMRGFAKWCRWLCRILQNNARFCKSRNLQSVNFFHDLTFFGILTSRPYVFKKSDNVFFVSEFFIFMFQTISCFWFITFLNLKIWCVFRWGTWNNLQLSDKFRDDVFRLFLWCVNFLYDCIYTTYLRAAIWLHLEAVTIRALTISEQDECCNNAKIRC